MKVSESNVYNAKFVIESVEGLGDRKRVGRVVNKIIYSAADRRCTIFYEPVSRIGGEESLCLSLECSQIEQTLLGGRIEIVGPKGSYTFKRISGAEASRRLLQLRLEEFAQQNNQDPIVNNKRLKSRDCYR